LREARQPPDVIERQSLEARELLQLVAGNPSRPFGQDVLCALTPIHQEASACRRRRDRGLFASQSAHRQSLEQNRWCGRVRVNGLSQPRHAHIGDCSTRRDASGCR
jgi:hypothetical protein